MSLVEKKFKFLLYCIVLANEVIKKYVKPDGDLLQELKQNENFKKELEELVIGLVQEDLMEELLYLETWDQTLKN